MITPCFVHALRQALNLDESGCQTIEVASSDSLRIQLLDHHDADLLMLDFNSARTAYYPQFLIIKTWEF